MRIALRAETGNRAESQELRAKSKKGCRGYALCAERHAHGAEGRRLQAVEKIV